MCTHVRIHPIKKNGFDLMSSVNINEDLFRELLNIFFSEDPPQSYEADIICQQLEEKLDKLISRELFLKYKRSPCGAEHETYRQRYLNHKCIPQSFRTRNEVEKNYDFFFFSVYPSLSAVGVSKGVSPFCPMLLACQKWYWVTDFGKNRFTAAVVYRGY